MEPRLHIFDLDGTLAEQWKPTLMPGVAELVPQLSGKIAVATNQAGVGWNAVKGGRYPEPSEVGNRLLQVAAQVPKLRDALWLVSIGDDRVSLPADQWRALAAAVTRAASPLWVRTSSDLSWRKPGPGMLLEACHTFDVPREEAIFVGDHHTDAEAAATADISFVRADRFFSTR